MLTARVWAATVAAIGLGTAVAAAQIATVTAGTEDARPDPRILRVLGCRQVLQGAVVVVRPSPRWIAAGVFADASHAVSMAGLAMASPRYRRPALISGIVAATSGVVGAGALHRS